MFIDVIGYEGLYQVNNRGDVKSLKNNIILKPTPNTWGYLSVSLYNDGNRKVFTIHRLVALHFIEKNLDLVVNHIDGDKLNNNVYNLEFITQAENLNHAYRLGLNKIRGEDNSKAKLNKKQVFEIYDLATNKTYTQEKIAKLYGVDRTTVGKIKSKKLWSHIH